MVKYFIIRRPFIMAREKKPVHKVQMTEENVTSFTSS